MRRERQREKEKESARESKRKTENEYAEKRYGIKSLFRSRMEYTNTTKLKNIRKGLCHMRLKQTIIMVVTMVVMIPPYQHVGGGGDGEVEVL